MPRLESQASEAGVTVLAASIPLDLESGTLPTIPSTKFRVAFTASFTGTSDAAVATLRAALKAGHIIDIDVQDSGEEGWEKLEDLLTKATAEAPNTGYIILCECPDVLFPHKVLISDNYSQHPPSPARSRASYREIAHPSDLPVISVANRDLLPLPESLPFLCSTYMERTHATHASLRSGSADLIKGTERMEAQDQDVL